MSHQTPSNFLGNGLAKSCEENGGAKVTLREHMTKLSSEIGFNPCEFKHDHSEDTVTPEDVVPIKATQHFTPKCKVKLVIKVYVILLQGW